MLASLLLAAAVAAPARAPLAAPVFTTSATTPQRIPARFPGRVLVQVLVDGHPLWFHLDTGTSVIAIDAGAATRAGVVSAPGARFATADLAVGAFDARQARVVLLPRYGFEDGGVHVSGLIGTPFLASQVVTIDYPDHRLVAYPKGTFDARALHVSATPIDFNGSIVRVHAWFGSKEATMLMDTGAQRTMLFEPFANGVSVGAPLGPARSITVGIGTKPTWERRVQTRSLIFGNVRFRNPIVLVVDDAPPFLPSSRFDGILGRDVYPEFRITLDYADDAIYLEPK